MTLNTKILTLLVTAVLMPLSFLFGQDIEGRLLALNEVVNPYYKVFNKGFDLKIEGFRDGEHVKIDEVNVYDFLNSYVENEKKKEDSIKLIELFTKWTGFEPRMWGPTIIGFGHYHYKYASGHEGNAPILGFSPRKAQFSLYIYSETEKSDELLKEFGKFKMGKACIYIKRLSDISIPNL